MEMRLNIPAREPCVAGVDFGKQFYFLMIFHWLLFVQDKAALIDEIKCHHFPIGLYIVLGKLSSIFPNSFSK